VTSARAARAAAVALAASVGVAAAQPDSGAIPQADAARIFARAHALCTADAGRLWGVSLCVPIVLADPNTHAAVANTALRGSVRDGSLFRFRLPAGSLISSTPTVYEGVRVAEISWPLYGGAETEAVTLMHESFHVVQPKLGFNGYPGTSSISGDPFLDTQAGRTWLRGEFRALRVALQTTGASRASALHDALAMRFFRASLSTSTAEEEREQEIMEGLAEATGIDAGLAPDRRIAYALHDIAFVEEQPSYARSFPYAIGPAYSELLDAVTPNWRRSVTPSSNIARMAMEAYDLTVTAPSASQAQAIIARYGGAAIESQEAALAARKVALHTKYTRELVAGSTITLPMAHFRIRFDPRDIETFAPNGSVYHSLTLSAPWGTITVSGGDAMISNDFRFLTVAAPSDVRGSTMKGEGWTLALAPGYSLVSNPEKSGSYIVSVGR
jgi:hypothetical protein